MKTRKRTIVRVIANMKWARYSIPACWRIAGLTARAEIRFGEIPVHESEVVNESALDADDPAEEEFEGYTGNAGMTLERWYHRAAVVIWPRTEHFCGPWMAQEQMPPSPVCNRWCNSSNGYRKPGAKFCAGNAVNLRLPLSIPGGLTARACTGRSQKQVIETVSRVM